MPTVTKPYAAIHVVMRGIMSGSQTWSTGFWLFPSISPSPTQLQTFCDSIAGTPLQTWLTTASGIRTVWQSGATTLTSMSCYYYAPTTAIATVSALTSVSTNNTGTGGGAVPMQAAVVHSLRTATPGRRGRGRCYFPANGATLTGSNLSSTVTTALSNSFRTYLDAVNATALGAGTVVAIVATSLMNPAPAVTRVVVDSELDVQRRRANKILGTSIVSSAL